MDRNKALSIVKEQLPEKRFEHTVRVMETAIPLAVQFGIDEKKAELAAIFHDYAKYRPKEEMKQWILKEKLPFDLLQFHHELWHAPVGSLLVKKEVGITDEEILDAIKYHTTGRAKMKPLEKVIYLADYMEPGRNFPGVEKVRELAHKDLDSAMIQALKNTIQYLISKDQPIYPDTFHTYNDLIRLRRDNAE